MSIDLTPNDIAELDDLLADTPDPLEPQDVVMLDGYLAGVAVQPAIVAPESWLRWVFDEQGRALPQDTDTKWLSRCRALIQRRFEAMTIGLAEDRWFDPIIIDVEQLPALSEYDEPQTVVQRSLGAWVSGFAEALERFPTLSERTTHDEDLLAHVGAVLRLSMGDEQARVAGLTPFDASKAADDNERVQRAVDDLMASLHALWQGTEADRMRVQPVVNSTPKVGRNDPCPCGSGLKFKRCHAVA